MTSIEVHLPFSYPAHVVTCCFTKNSWSPFAYLSCFTGWQQAAYGVSLSYGMLLHGLVSCGHGGVVQLAKDQGEVWRSIVEREVGMWRINVTKNNFRIMIMITAVGLAPVLWNRNKFSHK